MIVILGSNSRLGSYYSRYLKARAITHFNVQRGALNFAYYDNLLKALPTHKIDYIVNFCALTNVDECEKNYHRALEANATIVEKICDYQKINTGFHLIHISTDHVYTDSGFHSEDECSPKNCYSKTKLLGEFYASNIGATIIRTNFFGKTHTSTSKKTFTDWLFDAGVNGTPLEVYSNILFNPVRMETLSNVITKSMMLKYSGIINIGSKNSLSKEQFAKTFFEYLNLDKDLLTTALYKPEMNFAIRPLDMRMDVSKAIREIGYDPPSIENEIFLEVKNYLNKTDE